MMIRLTAAFLILATAAVAQIMTPNIVPPGGIGQMNPNQGDMTPNALPATNNVITCSGTGYNFTLSCNSQYIVVL